MKTHIRSKVRTAAVIVGMGALVVMGPNGAYAQGVFSDWATAVAPTQPELKPVKVDPKTTALLLLDFGANCSQNPRCAPSVPKLQRLVTEARTHGMTIVYTHTQNQKPGDIPPEIAPAGGEQNLDARANKFYNSEMDPILKAKGVNTVIIAGTLGSAAVVYTAVGAVERGYKVIVPVDTMPTQDVFSEEVTVYMLTHGPISASTTVTSAGMVTFP